MNIVSNLDDVEAQHAVGGNISAFHESDYVAPGNEGSSMPAPASSSESAYARNMLRITIATSFEEAMARSLSIEHERPAGRSGNYLRPSQEGAPEFSFVVADSPGEAWLGEFQIGNGFPSSIPQEIAVIDIVHPLLAISIPNKSPLVSGRQLPYIDTLYSTDCSQIVI